jgi:hypothetical protein
MKSLLGFLPTVQVAVQLQAQGRILAAGFYRHDTPVI